MSIDTGTHIGKLKGRYQVTSTQPTSPQDGDRYFDAATGLLYEYDGDNGRWLSTQYTSTSTSTTTTTSTSSSSSTTSTSSSTTTTTSTSTTTSV